MRVIVDPIASHVLHELTVNPLLHLPVRREPMVAVVARHCAVLAGLRVGQMEGFRLDVVLTLVDELTMRGHALEHIGIPAMGARASGGEECKERFVDGGAWSCELLSARQRSG